MAFVSAVNVGFYNLLKLWPETWVKNTAYTLGDLIKPTTYTSSSPAEGSRHSYKCTTAGTSAATEATSWNTTNGGTTSDGTVTWTTFDGKCYQIKAPQGSAVPYVTFAPLTGVTKGTFASLTAIEDLTFWINVFSDKSTADISEIADEVMAVMDNGSLTVSGYTSMVCRREFLSGTIYDSETGIFQISLRYRVWLDKS